MIAKEGYSPVLERNKHFLCVQVRKYVLSYFNCIISFNIDLDNFCHLCDFVVPVSSSFMRITTLNLVYELIY